MNQNIIINTMRSIRAFVTKNLFPKKGYFLFPAKSLRPISAKFGFDRGTPVDRSYIEQFIRLHAAHIKGVCLEIHDNYYTKKFGGSHVTKSDVLDINADNTQANIYGDLRDIPDILNDTYDCVILTHTLGVIDNHEGAVQELLRILKPGGVILVTVSAMGVAQDPAHCFWRYTPAGLKYLFKKYLPDGNIETTSYGNVLSGQAFWVGLAAEELSAEELSYNDPRYAIVSAGVIQKK
ncbi:MAG: methyltransferase domain-containing protein [bacterium]|nr:methyltransferase domain-containing protein [bacterium]